MSKIEDLRKAWEEADAKSVKLSAEYQEKIDKQVTAPWQKLKDQYSDKLVAASREAAEAQSEYATYQAAAALLERGEEGESTLGNHSGPGGERLHRAYEDLKANASDA